MVSPFSDPKPLNEDRGLAKFWDADGALVKTQEAAAPASSADGQAASPKIPVSIHPRAWESRKCTS